MPSCPFWILVSSREDKSSWKEGGRGHERWFQHGLEIFWYFLYDESWIKQGKNDDEMKTKMSGIVSCMSIFVLSKSLLLQPVGVNVPFYLSNGTVAFSPIPTLSLKLKGNCPILSQLKSLGHFAINIFLLFMGRCGAFMVFSSTRRTVIIIM